MRSSGDIFDEQTHGKRATCSQRRLPRGSRDVSLCRTNRLACGERTELTHFCCNLPPESLPVLSPTVVLRGTHNICLVPSCLLFPSPFLLGRLCSPRPSRPLITTTSVERAPHPGETLALGEKAVETDPKVVLSRCLIVQRRGDWPTIKPHVTAAAVVPCATKQTAPAAAAALSAVREKLSKGEREGGFRGGWGRRSRPQSRCSSSRQRYGSRRLGAAQSEHHGGVRNGSGAGAADNPRRHRRRVAWPQPAVCEGTSASTHTRARRGCKAVFASAGGWGSREPSAVRAAVMVRLCSALWASLVPWGVVPPMPS